MSSPVLTVSDAGTDTAVEPHDVAGPYFEDLEVGMVEDGAPSLTLTEGHAALHQAILGSRLRLCLDAQLCNEVTGRDRMLAHPQLVCDVAIGQSTVLTGRVIANLFYRGLAFRRAPLIGDTLHTTTEVVALRQTTPRPGRAATGLAALRIRTVDQEGRQVLDFWRCAMLPLRDPEGRTGHADDLEKIAPVLDAPTLAAPTRGWRLDRFRAAARTSRLERGSRLRVGERWRVEHGEVVSCGPELARLSLNVAAAHHDRYSNRGGQRLLYGGHTIGIAAAQATRALPDLVTIVAWHGCDHTAPVYEGDTLTSTLELERIEPLPLSEGGVLAHLRSRVTARRDEDGSQLAGGGEGRASGEAAGGGQASGIEHQVLDWRFVAVLPSSAYG